jgi:hypothetical protein
MIIEFAGSQNAGTLQFYLPPLEPVLHECGLPREQRRVRPMQCESTITCPHCGHAETETMPTDACQWFYVCTGCGTVLTPKPGDCCVFCSYGTVRCPPVQKEQSCCD